MRSPLIIWLHGLGDTGRGWSHLKHELRLPQAVRYAFPDAPESPVTCNGGYVMTSWMDLETIPIGNGLPDDAKGLADSTQIIHALIDAEVAKGTASEDIVLGGFSQGGAMALLAGYSYAKRLAGVACLSGWPSLRAQLTERVGGGANAGTPLFIGHGTQARRAARGWRGVKTRCSQRGASAGRRRAARVRQGRGREAHGGGRAGHLPGLPGGARAAPGGDGGAPQLGARGAQAGGRRVELTAVISRGKSPGGRQYLNM
mmetsp:Transcript_3287/g.9580  ORF Transcript_3287/g.9580 Transcript_3287/m.9580 type:complete len:258 (-) Transcript_3287:94-867(-)